MGVCYYIVNEKHEELYELNKGGWNELTPEMLSDVEQLKNFLRDRWLVKDLIIIKLANRIIEWSRGSPMHIINDSMDYDPCFDTGVVDELSYPKTGDIYD